MSELSDAGGRKKRRTRSHERRSEKEKTGQISPIEKEEKRKLTCHSARELVETEVPLTIP